jgi:esterase/lipase superfamily enzyme
VTPQPDDQLWAELANKVKESQGKEAFVFVHGYDTTFEDAALRTAQIAYDLAFDGAPVCYSWPSHGDLADYPKDETNAQWTVPHLKNFLQVLAAKAQAKTIHVIAHSMGNRAVSHALQLLAGEVQTKPCRMRHVVLTAPDIDADTFRDLAEAVKSVADRVTVYISPVDKALVISKRFHGNPRLGETVLVIPGIDTIDASRVDTSFIGHSYYAENRSVLSDIFWLLKDGKPPRERFGMRMVHQGADIYYAFRP